MSMLKTIYRTGNLLAPFALLPAFLWTKRGRTRYLERLGFWRVPSGTYTWFHGASVGEIRGLIPIIQKFKTLRPSSKVLLTATSVTAFESGGPFADATALLPFDNAIWIDPALKGLEIEQLIIAETELWPSLIELLSSRKIPMSIVNARISKYSFPRYQEYGGLFASVLPAFSHILCGDANSASRFLELGAKPHSVLIAGNTKYDLLPSVQDNITLTALKKDFFEKDAPIFVAGSLRPGEDDIIFPVLAKLLKEGSAIQSIIAPRHQEKFKFFAERLSSHGIPFRKWSERAAWQATDRIEPVVLLDAYGILEKVYAIASLAFIGGSLVDIGGHNPLEAAAYSVPVMMGPHVSNVEEVCEALHTKEALCTVENAEDLERWLRRMYDAPALLRQYGERGKEVWATHHGTVSRVCSILFQKGTAQADAS